jgi:geranylgeranyl diphosphate synthase type II
MNLKVYLKEKKGLVDAYLDNCVPVEDRRPESLHRSIRYSIQAGGKRVRPILALAAADAVLGRDSSDEPGVMATACSLELIHTYSLIHDDLPAMDDDDLRRGKPTNHKVFGESVAILAGDGLLTYAFDLLTDPRHTSGLEPSRLIQIIHEIAVASGGLGMVGGQVVDIESEGKEVDFATLEYIHTHKTGALLRASVRVGAMAANASDEQLKALTRYGTDVGLAFQIADDILDIVGDEAEIGKDVGSDIERGKKTYPSFVGLEESRLRARELADSSIASLDMFGDAAEPLRVLADYIVSRTN